VRSAWFLSSTALILLVCSACSKQDKSYPRRLSEWKVVESNRIAALQPVAAAVRYELKTPLFSDYAEKDRVVLFPSASTKATFNEFAVYDFPTGTIIAKTFSFADRRIETRILVHEKSGWVGLPYVWHKDQTDAVLELVPDPVAVAVKDPVSGQELRFDYIIPNANQCKNCHENSGVMKPIGPKAFHLSSAETKKLTGIEPAMTAPLETLDQQARAYLDINCGHCHNTKGPANTSGLVLTYGETDPGKLGVCKTPVAAGQGSGDHRFGIVPGRPDESILLYRMRSTTPKVQMPELGRSVVHQAGVDLIRRWIASLPANGSGKGGCGA
jgi:hypothetical protein